MYLDENLVRNLSSLLLSGYIDIRTTRLIQDQTLSGRAALEFMQHGFQDNRNSDTMKDGYKETNLAESVKSDQAQNTIANLENRQFIRREQEEKKIFTTFTLHSQLISGLTINNQIKSFNNKTIVEGEVKAGQYILLNGDLKTESVNSYLDSLLTIFDCYGCECLDGLMDNQSENIKSFKNAKHLISHLYQILNKNSTEDMILNCGDTKVVLNVNNNFFMNNNAYIYDKVDCPCTVFGKVINVASSGECVGLLRKTTQQEFYHRILNSCHNSCIKLEEKGIFIPKMPTLKCEGLSLIVMPISICI